MNLKIIDVLGDGNCMYRAVAHGFLGDEQRHREIRQAVIGEVEAHILFYEPFCVPYSDHEPETIEGAIRDMKMPNSWGSNFHLVAAAKAYHRQINVISNGGIKVMDVPEASGSPIFLVYNGVNHYLATAPVVPC